MSTNDEVLLPTAEQIRTREFAAVLHGYDPEQVRAYLTSIANQIEPLLNRSRLEEGSAAAPSEQMAQPVTTSDPAWPAQDPYEALSKRFAALIEMADQEAERILENARSAATRAVEEATSEADRIRVDAQAHAEETREKVADLLERATTETDRVLSIIAERRQSLIAQLQETREKLIAMAEDLAAPIEGAARVDADDTELGDTTEKADDGDYATPVDVDTVSG